MVNESLGGLVSRPPRTGPTCTVKAKFFTGSQVQEWQELWQTLIPDPTGYIGAPSPKRESRNARRWPSAIQNRPNDEGQPRQTRNASHSAYALVMRQAADQTTPIMRFAQLPSTYLSTPGSVPTFKFLSRVRPSEDPSPGSVLTFKFLSGVRPPGPSRLLNSYQGSVPTFKFLSGVRPPDNFSVKVKKKVRSDKVNAQLYGPECGLSSRPALRAFGSRGLRVSTFPWGCVTGTRERRSRHLSFYDPKVEGG
ncbi:hypothetical protein CRG98_001905 [Punica granatum]|uniref:Uncharacterized protein n=1 Tax=Punica granatum TaxID=22663 RepID=A0A2I0LAH1_PUNGR|nr:hypothetical protein CRG98_001905 [Punica granatum]